MHPFLRSASRLAVVAASGVVYKSDPTPNPSLGRGFGKCIPETQKQ